MYVHILCAANCCKFLITDVPGVVPSVTADLITVTANISIKEHCKNMGVWLHFV